MIEFKYEYIGQSSRCVASGTVAFDIERKQWKATIITQESPENRFESWDADPAVAGLLACAKWMGRELKP